MPRHARVASSTGIYHIMLRGIDGQPIFNDDEENRKFLFILKDCKEICKFKLLAYCLMVNHVHLLLEVNKEGLDLIMKRIGTRYVYWYNQKHKRKGHLFQDRFKSEPVEDEAYLLSALRYIHLNPVKAEMVTAAENYPYSSFPSYFYHKNDNLTDVGLIYSLTNHKELVVFHNQDHDDHFLDTENKSFPLTDEEAADLAKKIARCSSIDSIAKLSVNERNDVISKLKKADLSIRQISRITGISKSIIEHIH